MQHSLILNTINMKPTNYTLFLIAAFALLIVAIYDRIGSIKRVDHYIGDVHYITFTSHAGIAVVNYTSDSLVALVRENARRSQ